MHAEDAAIVVRIAWSAAPGVADEIELRLPRHATVADAIEAWRLHTGADMAAASIGVWGRQRPGSTPLKEGDRVEIYRPLEADPMEARRARQRRDRTRRGGATCNPKR